MGAPVHENGVVVGSLVVGSLTPGRSYSEAEQEILLSFADHVSLALTDAMTAQSLMRALQDARHDALHDELTQLPNRALLRVRLDQAWARGRRSHSPMALLFLDFDDFKDINDSLGHDAGDQLLVTLAARLAESLRPGDTIARLGGDEFAVLIENLDTAPPVEGVASRLLEVLTTPVDLNGRSVTMRGSIGIAVSDYSETDSQSLLYSADLAMYSAKRMGGGRCVRYQPDMHQGTVDRLDTEQALKVAIADRPAGACITSRCTTFAAAASSGLRRWCGGSIRTRGLIGPMEFVPVAESSRLITGLGAWVLAQGVRAGGDVAERHRDRGQPVAAPARAGAAGLGARDSRLDRVECRSADARGNRRNRDGRRGRAAAHHRGAASRWVCTSRSTTSVPATRRWRGCARCRSTS